ncbi:DUF899 family protein [Streptomyces umbrinus]
MPWYSLLAESHEQLVSRRHFGMEANYFREGDRVYKTYWSTGRGVEPMAPSYGILDMTVHGRQETWEDFPSGCPQPCETLGQQFRKDGRPTAQWAGVTVGHDDLHSGQPGTGGSLLRLSRRPQPSRKCVPSPAADRSAGCGSSCTTGCAIWPGSRRAARSVRRRRS